MIESAVACYKGQFAASVRGEVHLYRPQDCQAQARRRKMLIAKLLGISLPILQGVSKIVDSELFTPGDDNNTQQQ